MQKVIQSIAQEMQRHGGQAFLVGGLVRDKILGVESHDIDMEVFGLPIDQMETILKTFGPVSHAGKQFAILLLQSERGPIEVAAPRREVKTGSGHRGFSVEIDPQLSPRDAARRRDFTINAIMLDPLTEHLLDPFDGQTDIRNKILRVVDEHTFQEDPLRVLRAIQLTARLELTIEPKTLALLKRMVSTVRELPKFRLEPEWSKLFLRSMKPSIGLQLAHDIGYFRVVSPVLDQLVQTQQDPEYHPEGTVWQHTLSAVDAAASLVRKYHPDHFERLEIMLAVWLHDIGKAETTTMRDGRITSYNHDTVGAALAKDFLLSQGFSQAIVETVATLIREHMHLQHLETLEAHGQLTDGALRRLVNRLGSIKPELLLTVREADATGRGSENQAADYPPRKWFLPRLEKLGLQAGAASLIRGQDLLDLGWTQDKNLGEVIQAAESYAEDHNATREQVLEIIRAAGSPTVAIQHFHAESP